jgi:hypothetical protein
MCYLNPKLVIWRQDDHAAQLTTGQDVPRSPRGAAPRGDPRKPGAAGGSRHGQTDVTDVADRHGHEDVGTKTWAQAGGGARAPGMGPDRPTGRQAVGGQARQAWLGPRHP